MRIIRAGAVVAGSALSLGLLSVAPAAQAAAPHDAAPAKSAARWISRQLTGGLLHSDVNGTVYTDRGGSADAVISLAAVGRQRPLMRRISAALAADIDAYVTGVGYLKVDPGAAAKAAVALKAARRSTTAVGPKRHNLVAEVASTVQPSGRVAVLSTTGKIDPDYEWANVLSQSYAVRALQAARSPKAAAATRFLLTQQCGPGWFRVYFTDTDPDPYRTVSNDTRCSADPTASPSVDSTAVAVAALAPQVGKNRAVTRAVRRATAWLAKQQLSNGGFSDGTAEAAGHANANSTGLAGWALGDLGRKREAKLAAIWVRRHQLRNVGPCAPFARRDNGALAYDDTARAGAETAPIGANNSQFNSAAVQALGVLKFAPNASGKPTFVTSLTKKRRAGSTVVVRAKGFAPGATACVTAGGVSKAVLASRKGRVSAKVTLPAAGKLRVVVRGGSKVLRGSIKVRS